VCDDFNAVRCMEGRKSVGVVVHYEDIDPFTRFIEENFLVGLPLGGRACTWYRGDGRSMSCLDRFLLSEAWCLTWTKCLHMAQIRGLSDHCHVVLCGDEQNWGPRPTRMLKCWSEIPGYK
jgi:hypothetical protein